jgi:hypothetical protein
MLKGSSERWKVPLFHCRNVQESSDRPKARRRTRFDDDWQGISMRSMTTFTAASRVKNGRRFKRSFSSALRMSAQTLGGPWMPSRWRRRAARSGGAKTSIPNSCQRAVRALSSLDFPERCGSVPATPLSLREYHTEFEWIRSETMLSD